MTRSAFVVLARRAVEFETFEEACAFARRNYPAVVCERVVGADGRPMLEERLRCDLLFDEREGEWRVLLG